MKSARSSFLLSILAIILVAVLYASSGMAGQFIAGDGHGVSLLWPPTGVAVAALTRWGLRLWPGLVIGSLVVNLSLGSSVVVAAGISLGNTVGPLVVAALLQRLHFAPGFPARRHVWWFFIAAIIGMLIPASNGVAWLAYGGLAIQMKTWLSWFSGDVIGVILIAPVVLAWVSTSSAFSRLRQYPIEAGLVLCGSIVFSGFVFLWGHHAPISFITLLPLVWMSLRFGVWASTMMVLTIGLIAAWGTAVNTGPFAHAEVDAFILLALFLSLVAIINLILGSLLIEYEHALSLAKERQQRLELAIFAGDVALWQWDSVEDSVRLSPEWKRQLGYADHELTDTFQALVDHLHPDDRLRAVADLQAYARSPGESSYSDEFRLRHRDGSWRWILARARLDRSRDDQHTVLVGCHIDITARRQAEQDLRDSEARCRTLVDHSPNSLVLFNLTTGYFSDFNDHACSLFGLTRSELLLKSPADVSTPTQADGRDSKTAAREYLKLACEGQTPRFEWTHIHKDGHTIPCEVTLVHLPSSTGLVIRGEIIDISHRKRAEIERLQHAEQRQHAQKLEAIGTLAGGIAHDFNNLLAGIIGNAENGMAILAQQDPHYQRLLTIQQAGLRGRDVVKQILAFSRRQPQHYGAVQLGAIAKEAAHLLHASLPATVTLVVTVADDAPTVLADATQLHQIVMNLATNAWQALPNGHGHITIIVDRFENNGQSYGRLQVIDDGEGMTPEVAARVCEPFFTTKHPGQGTGLGLAVVFGIVENHAGTLTINSTPHQGTQITICLPQHAPTISEKSFTKIVHGQGEQILLVDDEAMLVELGIEQLKLLGYQPTGVTDPQQAVALVRAEPQRWRLVISDLTMPVMDGIELARALFTICRNLPVILSSGYGAALDAKQDSSANIVAILDKPVEVSVLSQTIHQHLSPSTP